MKSIAIIAEGVTDQILLEAVVIQFAKRVYEVEVDVVYAQPRQDQTDRANEIFGGWELVFKACHEQLESALSINDLAIIHIDTDVCENANFGIALTSSGAMKPYEDLVADVQARIIAEIGEARYEAFRERIIFAIAVHSLECWLLWLLFPAFSGEKTRRCEEKLGNCILYFTGADSLHRPRDVNAGARWSRRMPELRLRSRPRWSRRASGFWSNMAKLPILAN